MLKITDVDVAHKRVLIRVDLNVPFSPETGEITSDLRIRAVLPTIQYVLKAGGGVILLSHLGRPAAGEYDAKYSMARVSGRLSELLGMPVDVLGDAAMIAATGAGTVSLVENVRFYTGETSNDPALAQLYTRYIDVFVMDAFACAHRAHASTVGAVDHAPVSCAGLLLMKEVDALKRVMAGPEKPVVAIVGGSKVSTKLGLLAKLSERVDQLIVGGGIANTFLAAAGQDVGRSLYEPNLVGEAQALMAKLSAEGGYMPLPVDVVTTKELSAEAVGVCKRLDELEPGDMIVDIGPESLAELTEIIGDAKTIIWNGPLGVFEYPAFAAGTEGLARAIAGADAYTLAGGGDTVAAIDLFGVRDDVSYISTGGGAFLEYIEGKKLPGIAALEKASAKV